MSQKERTKLALIDANMLKSELNKTYGNIFSKYVIAAVTSLIDNQPRLTNDAADVILRALFDQPETEKED